MRRGFVHIGWQQGADAHGSARPSEPGMQPGAHRGRTSGVERKLISSMCPLVGLKPSLAFSAAHGVGGKAIFTRRCRNCGGRQCCLPSSEEDASHKQQAPIPTCATAPTHFPPTCSDAHCHDMPQRRHAAAPLEIDCLAALWILAIQAPQVWDAVQRHTHADCQLAGRDVDVADPLSHRMLHLQNGEEQIPDSAIVAG